MRPIEPLFEIESGSLTIKISKHSVAGEPVVLVVLITSFVIAGTAQRLFSKSPLTSLFLSKKKAFFVR